MNGEQAHVFKSALIKCVVTIFAIIIAMVVVNIIAYNIGAKTDLTISSIATQQLVDGGQTYQQMKTASYNYFQFNSIFYWIRLFVIISGIAYIVYLMFNTYKHIMELGSKKE